MIKLFAAAGFFQAVGREFSHVARGKSDHDRPGPLVVKSLPECAPVRESAFG
jgi:hypothetical protein